MAERRLSGECRDGGHGLCRSRTCFCDCHADSLRGEFCGSAIMTYEEIGVIFGISKARAQQIGYRALQKMARHPIMKELARQRGIA